MKLIVILWVKILSDDAAIYGQTKKYLSSMMHWSEDNKERSARSLAGISNHNAGASEP